VVRLNGGDTSARAAYAELAQAAGIVGAGESHEHALGALLQRLEAVLNLAGFPASLADCGVKREAIPALSEEAARQWTAGFNPRKVTAKDFEALYEAAF
jgi:alcohol dehydrogenase